MLPCLLLSLYPPPNSSSDSRHRFIMSSDPAPSLPPRFKRPMPTFTPFKEVEVTRVDFDANSEYHVSKTP